MNTHMGAGCVSVLFIVGFCEFSILILSLRLKDRQLKKNTYMPKKVEVMIWMMKASVPLPA